MASTKKLSNAAAYRFDTVQAIGQLLCLFQLWLHRARSRRALESLDARLLRDIGLGRLAAAEEARKHFWQK